MIIPGVRRVCLVAPVRRYRHGIDTVRLDQWLHAVRLTRTRSAAAEAARAGHVTVNARTAKPSTGVSVGDRVVARVAGRTRTVEVRRLVVKRVGAATAVDCYIDHTPIEPSLGPTATFARRDPGSGRPTKRDRRQIDRLRGRD